MMKQLKPLSNQRNVIVALLGVVLLISVYTIFGGLQLKKSSMQSQQPSYAHLLRFRGQHERRLKHPTTLTSETYALVLEQLQRQFRLSPTTGAAASSYSSSRVKFYGEGREEDNNNKQHHRPISKHNPHLLDSRAQYNVAPQSRYILSSPQSSSRENNDGKKTLNRKEEHHDSDLLEITRLDMCRVNFDEPFMYYRTDPPEQAIDGDLDSGSQADACEPVSWFEMDLALPLSLPPLTNQQRHHDSDNDDHHDDEVLHCVRVFSRRDYLQYFFTDIALVLLDARGREVFRSPWMNQHATLEKMILNFDLSSASSSTIRQQQQQVATVRIEKQPTPLENSWLPPGLPIGEVQLFTDSSECSIPRRLVVVPPALAAPQKRLALFEHEQYRLMHQIIVPTVHCRDRRFIGGRDGAMDGGWSLCFDSPALKKLVVVAQQEKKHDHHHDQRHEEPGSSSSPSSCVVYSVGSMNDFAFDDEMALEYGCTVHTFDHTLGWPEERVERRIPPSSPVASTASSSSSGKKSNSGGKVYKYGFGLSGDPKSSSTKMRSLKQLMSIANTPRITVLKFDIEGHEWSIFDTVLEIAATGVIDQVMFELHFDEPSIQRFLGQSPRAEGASWGGQADSADNDDDGATRHQEDHDIVHLMYRQLSRFHEHFYLFGQHVNTGAKYFRAPMTMMRCIDLYFVRK